MSSLLHLGIEYSDLGLRTAMLVDGRLYRIDLPIEDQILVDPRGGPPFGVEFPGLFRMIGAPEVAKADHVLDGLLRLIRRIAEEKFKRRFGRLVIAVPTGLMSLRRSILVAATKAAGFDDVELVDVSIPSALVYSSGTDTPTTQLVYYVGYGECEYALLRVVRGRVKVLGSGIAGAVSGQQFDLQMMESIIRALREKNIFLGLKGYRNKQWREFRKIAADARRQLTRKAAADITLPPTLARDGDVPSMTLSAFGFAARLIPAITSTIEDIHGLLEQNEIKPTEVDAVIALGDTATKYPVTALLDRAFPDRLLIGDVNIVAAATAIYAASLERDPSDETRVEESISHYLSPYQALSDLPLQTEDGQELPVVTAVSINSAVPATAGAAADGNSGPEAASRSAPEPVASVAAAKEMIERGRNLIHEATQLLQRLDLENQATEPPDQVSEQSDGQVLMDQAENMLARGLYAEAVSLAHRAHEEARLDGGVFARMLRVHVNASLAFNEPEQYDDAIKLLMCAHSHDRTEQSVHKALAARHVQHANAMSEQEPIVAIRAAELALRFEPKNQDAQALLEKLRSALPKAE